MAQPLRRERVGRQHLPPAHRRQHEQAQPRHRAHHHRQDPRVAGGAAAAFDVAEGITQPQHRRRHRHRQPDPADRHRQADPPVPAAPVADLPHHQPARHLRRQLPHRLAQCQPTSTAEALPPAGQRRLAVVEPPERRPLQTLRLQPPSHPLDPTGVHAVRLPLDRKRHVPERPNHRPPRPHQPDHVQRRPRVRLPQYPHQRATQHHRQRKPQHPRQVPATPPARLVLRHPELQVYPPRQPVRQPLQQRHPRRQHQPYPQTLPHAPAAQPLIENPRHPEAQRHPQRHQNQPDAQDPQPQPGLLIRGSGSWIRLRHGRTGYRPRKSGSLQRPQRREGKQGKQDAATTKPSHAARNHKLCLSMLRSTKPLKDPALRMRPVFRCDADPHAPPHPRRHLLPLLLFLSLRPPSAGLSAGELR